MGISFPNLTMADVFTGQPFRAVTLTTSINNVPYTPNFLGQLPGLYYQDGIRTTDIAVQERNGALTIVKTSPRGSDPEPVPHAKGSMRKATAVHIALQDTVNADEVQNAINSGAVLGQTQLQSAQEVINERMEGPFGLRARIELTHEYHRLGGLQGLVLDADGEVLYDWYDFFKIAKPDAIVINFDTFTAEGALFETTCTGLKRQLVGACSGLPITAMRPVALCGDDFYDKVYGNKEAKAVRKNRDAGRDGDVFAQNKAYSTFEFGGITWVNYRGTDDGKVGIGAKKARLFPYGVPGLFQMLFAPPDIMGMTNVKGLPVFSYMPPERQTSKGAVLEAQSNPLTMCLRPKGLLELTLPA